MVFPFHMEPVVIFVHPWLFKEGCICIKRACFDKTEIYCFKFFLQVVFIEIAGN